MIPANDFHLLRLSDNDIHILNADVRECNITVVTYIDYISESVYVPR